MTKETLEMMESNYNECLQYIEQTNNVKLYPFQKIMLYYMMQGREVRSPRGCGRGMIAKGIGQYITQRLSAQDYTKRPECTITADVVMAESNLLTETALKTAKRLLGDDEFEVEYYGKLKEPANG